MGMAHHGIADDIHDAWWAEPTRQFRASYPRAIVAGSILIPRPLATRTHQSLLCYFAASKFSATLSQFTTFQNAAM